MAHGRAPDVATKIDRARKHVREFYAARRAIFASGGYGIQLEELNEDTREIAARVKLDPEFAIPPRIGAIIGDIAHNLRSALDVLVCELVRANGRRVRNGSAFPVGAGPRPEHDATPEARAAWESEKQKRLEKQLAGVAPEARLSIERIGAYKAELGLGLFLFQLHQVNRHDKHHLLDAGGRHG